MKQYLLFPVLAVAGAVATAAPAAPRCPFDEASLSFAGSDIEQARCLLTPVGYVGHLGATPTSLGPFLEARIGRPVAIRPERLRALLVAEGLAELAETVSRPLSRARNNSPSAPVARYFVIHDTSHKVFGPAWPPDDSPDLNHLGAKYPDGSWKAHTFTNRLGVVLLAYDYSKPWRAVRLERDEVTHGSAKGLFLHNELNQPRLAQANVTHNIFRNAPTPGFTARQYDRLALLYILASRRAGRWLVPAYHAVLDDGISGGHDDPQHFELDKWEAALARRAAELGEGS
jgi:hypothetical protein